jgi:predicted permease
MDRLRQDLIVSLRRLRKSPGFAFTAILTLALGIGANAAIFSAVNAVLFRSLPVERPKELVFLNLRSFKTELPVLSYPNYKDIRDRNDVLSGLASFRPAAVSFSGGGDNVRLWAYLVTGNYFQVLGVGPLRGRVLGPDDDKIRSGHPVIVISYNCWQTRFGGDQNIVGRRIKLNGLDFTVVGVAPLGFNGTEMIFSPDLWVPMEMDPQIEPMANSLDERRGANYFVFGRLKPGVNMPRAESALNAIAAQLGREYPDANDGMKIVLSPVGLFGTFFRGAIQGFAAVLMAVAALVLLIACVNLASLLLARASDRRKETSIRLALGASSGDLIRQLLTESVLLSILGGGAGLLLAKWLTDLFAAWRPPVDVPVIPTVTIDTPVLIFALVVSVLTGLFFGLIPALQSTRSGLASALKNDALIERLPGWHLRDALVTAQIALSVVLLIGSILVVRSLQHALTLNLGFDPQHAATVSFDLGLQGYDRARAREFERRAIQKVRDLPGIQSAGLINALPMTLQGMSNSSIYVEGKPVPRAADVSMAAMYWVGPGYLTAARTKLLAGRDFDDRDKDGAARVVIVNQAFVRQMLGTEDPIGKRFRYGAASTQWREIVGVVEDGKFRSLGESPAPAVFTPIEQSTVLETSIVARSLMPEHAAAALLRRAVLEIDPGITVTDVGSMTDQLGLALLPAKIAAYVLSAFGLLALVLAATGVYGVMAYAVSRRTREIGIRKAIGAAPAQVLRVVFSRAGMLLAIGMAAGIAMTLAGGKFLSQILYGVSARDPLTFTLAIALMMVVAIAACWFPARRAMAVDPVTALRTE